MNDKFHFINQKYQSDALRIRLKLLNDYNKEPEAHSTMYKELLDELGIEKVHVLAFSDGGPSAIQFALSYPDQCETLTLVACKSKTPPEETFIQSLVFGNIFKVDYLFWWMVNHQEKAMITE